MSLRGIRGATTVNANQAMKFWQLRVSCWRLSCLPIRVSDLLTCR